MHNHKDERTILERQREVTPWVGKVQLYSDKNTSSDTASISSVYALPMQNNDTEEAYMFSRTEDNLLPDLRSYQQIAQPKSGDVYVDGGYLRIDFDKARRNNNIFSKSLGWDEYYTDLYFLFSFNESHGIDSNEFIEAVVKFQWGTGMNEKQSDGIIGEKTWSKIVKKIIELNDPLTGESLQKAIRYNRNNSSTWISDTVRIQKIIGHHELTSLSEPAFAKHLALWQKNNSILPADGMLGTKTWNKLSSKLDNFKDVFQVDFFINYKAIIRPDNGARLFSNPTPYASQSSKIIAKGEEITVLGFSMMKAPGWAYVQSLEKEKGWLPSFYLVFLTGYDSEIFKEHHLVLKDISLTDLVKKNYKDVNIRIGFDERTIIEAIVILNEKIDGSAIYFEGEGSNAFLRDNIFDRDMAALRHMYQRAKIREGRKIYLPKDEYIYFLYDSGILSSRAEWKNDAIILGKSIYGFINGVQNGLNEASKDFVVGLWELLKSILSGDIIEDVKNIINAIEKHGTEIIDLLIEAGGQKYEILKNHLNHPNPEKRYYSFGFILGFIL